MPFLSNNKEIIVSEILLNVHNFYSYRIDTLLSMLSLSSFNRTVKNINFSHFYSQRTVLKNKYFWQLVSTTIRYLTSKIKTGFQTCSISRKRFKVSKKILLLLLLCRVISCFVNNASTDQPENCDISLNTLAELVWIH